MARGLGSGWHYESHRHSLASKGIKTGTRSPTLLYTPKRSLLNPDTGAEYSANAGDYWDVPKDKVLKENGVNLELLENGQVVKEEVKKADLVDEIYESQALQAKHLAQRPSVKAFEFDRKPYKYFEFTMENGDSYVVDSKGRITQSHRFRENPKDFSGQWLLEGVTHHHWSQHPIGWETIMKDPTIMKGGIVWDLDNGTTRSWNGQRVKYVTPMRGGD
jgi:hypothetical protein